MKKWVESRRKFPSSAVDGRHVEFWSKTTHAGYQAAAVLPVPTSFSPGSSWALAPHLRSSRKLTPEYKGEGVSGTIGMDISQVQQNYTTDLLW
jgi:hypothetical protein